MPNLALVHLYKTPLFPLYLIIRTGAELLIHESRPGFVTQT
jgi:hypothetical protein